MYNTSVTDKDGPQYILEFNNQNTEEEKILCILADYPALSVDRAGGGNPLYAE